jgi:hypothetical protein
MKEDELLSQPIALSDGVGYDDTPYSFGSY